MGELRNREQLEQNMARKMGQLSERHRRELEQLMGDPPNPERVPQSFWDRIERETEEAMASLLLLIMMQSATEHGARATMPENALRQRMESVAKQRASKVARGYREHSRERIRLSAKKLAEIRKRTGRITRREASQEIRKTFGAKRAARVASTETTVAQSVGGEEGIKATVGVSQDDTWFTEHDARVCPICEPLHDQPRSVWAARFPQGPPAHPDCRCWIDYAIDNPDLMDDGDGGGPTPSPPKVGPGETPAAPKRSGFVTKNGQRRRVYKIGSRQFMKSGGGVFSKEAVVMADAEKLDRLWSKDPEFYIPRGGGENEIVEGGKSRRERFSEFMSQSDEPIEMPSVSINAEGRFDGQPVAKFIDGRHRTSVLRDRGEKIIPVTVPRSDLKRARQLIQADT